MPLRKLGSTNLLASPIGLGLASPGRPGYINLGHADGLDATYEVGAMEAHTHQVLDAAYQAGVRYFDAARSYGRAEQFLDLYQIHSATLKSGVLQNQAVLDELARLKDDGTTIGLTVSGPRQREVIELATDLTVSGVCLFDTVQATWNVLERSTGPALAWAREAGLAIIVKEAVANGRLTARNADPAFAEQMTLLRDQADRLQTTVDALALAGVLAQPWVSLVLSGAARVDHLRSNLQALTVAWDDEAASRLQVLIEPPQVYWETRSRLRWN